MYVIPALATNSLENDSDRKKMSDMNYPLEEGEHDVLGIVFLVNGLLKLPQRLGCGQQGHDARHCGVRAWVFVVKHAQGVHLATDRYSL